jgi:hypothetical protein
MSEKRSSWGKPDDDGDDPKPAAKTALEGAKDKAREARDKAAELGGKAFDNMRPVADAVGAGVRAGLGKMGDALRVGDAPMVPAELLAQTDLPELTSADPLMSLASRLDREADFWRGVAMRQLERAAWTERLGVTSSVLLLIGGVVLAAIAAFRALFATKGSGNATAMLLGVGLLVLLVAALAVGSLASRLRRGQMEAVKDAMNRADLAEVRIHRLGLLMELRSAGRDGYVAALSDLESDVRKA